MKTALIVEDDPELQVLFRAALDHGGFEVILASNVREALAILEHTTPDIAFVDINMPERPGTDVLAHIRSTPKLKSATRTVVVTANTLIEEQAAALGADLFLLKPVHVSDMIQLAQRLTKEG